MATETMNYGYPKPGQDDFYDINQYNQAMEMIDEDIKEMDEEKQNNLGIGAFKGNIDMLGENGLPQTSSVCWCQAKELQGILPYESQNDYCFTLETNATLDNETASERSQRAIVYGEDGVRIFERLFADGEWCNWRELLCTDGDTKNNVVTFQSGDMENPTEWVDIDPVQSNEKHSSLWQKISLGIKNLRYLKKMLGSTDISKLGDGTITGALSALNTGIIPNYLSHSFGGVSKQGWYRIAKTNSRYGSNSCVISLKRSYNSPAPEYQKVQFFGVFDLRKFVSLAAFSKVHMWTKIRETWDEVNNYSCIEIYQSRESYNNTWFVFVEEASGVYGNDHWKAIPPELTQEAVSGVTVLTSLELPANNPA